jgi:hypothetical protein
MMSPTTSRRPLLLVADNILRMNCLCISASKERICSVLCTVAEYNCTLNAIEKWLRENTQQT